MLAFLSFDIEHDEESLGRFLAEMTESLQNIQVDHWSVTTRTSDPDSVSRLKDKIWSSDLMIVLVGANITNAANVAHEIELARSTNVPYFGIYLDGPAPEQLPPGLPANRIMRWDWQRIPAAITQVMSEGKHRQFR